MFSPPSQAGFSFLGFDISRHRLTTRHRARITRITGQLASSRESRRDFHPGSGNVSASAPIKALPRQARAHWPELTNGPFLPEGRLVSSRQLAEVQQEIHHRKLRRSAPTLDITNTEIGVNKDNAGPYPGTEPKHGSVMFTHYGEFFQSGELALRKLPDLMKMCDSMSEKYGGDLNQLLGVICLLLSDVPVDPLLTADAERKASVTSIMAASFLLHHPDHEQRARRIIESGNGVMILRIFGKLDVKEDGIGPLEHKVELFDDWDSYQRFLVSVVGEHNMARPRGTVQGGGAKGGTVGEARFGIITLSALFRGEEITHFTHEFDKELERLLPYTYCVLVRREGSQSIVAGMMIKSSMSNTQTLEFRELVSGFLEASPPLRKLAKKPMRFLPARVKVEGDEPMTEEECLRAMATQFYNHSHPPGHA
jgi:hypothetical protein